MFHHLENHPNFFLHLILQRQNYLFCDQKNKKKIHTRVCALAEAY